MTKADLQAEIDFVAKSMDQQKEASSGLAKLCACFKSSPRLNPTLDHEKDVFYALARVKLQIQLAEHEIIINSVYRHLTGADSCRNIGSHWQQIGF